MQANAAMAATPTSAVAAAAVVIEGVDKHFGKVQALRSLSAHIHYGRLTGLVGPDGAGKTTLMRIIAGFEEPTTGKVVIDGKDSTALAPEHRPVNMVFQKYALFPHLDVFDNVAFGLRLKKKPKDENKREVH